MNIYRFFVKSLATFFYVGYLPFIPGTFGSLAGIGLLCLIKDIPGAHILLVSLLMILGFLFAGEAEKMMNKKDAGCIVIDEVSGILLALLFIPYDAKLFVIAFLLFRILDTLKPYPAGIFEKLKGSLGIMSDDIVAGLYTNIILQVALRVASCKTS